MRNVLLLAAIATAALTACERTNPKSTEEERGQIVIGKVDSIQSGVLGESRTFWVHVPESASDPTLAATKYPVVYLLDGPEHFQSVVGLIKHLSGSNGNTFVPEMVIVAVSNTDRARDLTPTHVDVDFFTGQKIQYNSGGGGKFLDFLEKELIPFIDQKYPTTSYRTFVGHSFGGLSVINAIVSRPQLFNNYVAIDPSLWWDNQAFAMRADSALTAGRYDSKSLFVGVANTMPDGMTIDDLQNDTSKYTAHIRSILKFVKARESKSANGLQFQWKYYQDDDHSSVPLITEYDALRFIFAWYRLRGVDQYFRKTSKGTTDDLVKLINTHFEDVSRHFGYRQQPPESMINSLGYGFMYNQMPDKADAMFELNIQNYPGSPQAYEARGDNYLIQHDSLNAMASFSKCLEVGGGDAVKKKLDLLKRHE